MISQKQAVDNLQMTNDPKLPKAQEAMTGKENARNNCRTKYEVFYWVQFFLPLPASQNLDLFMQSLELCAK